MPDPEAAATGVSTWTCNACGHAYEVGGEQLRITLTLAVSTSSNPPATMDACDPICFDAVLHALQHTNATEVVRALLNVIQKRVT